MKTLRAIIITLDLAGVVLAAGLVLAAPANPTVASHVMGGGGGRAAAGAYVLEGTVGQPMVGAVQSGSTAIGAGFWHAAGTAGPVQYDIHLPVVLRAS